MIYVCADSCSVKAGEWRLAGFKRNLCSDRKQSSPFCAGLSLHTQFCPHVWKLQLKDHTVWRSSHHLSILVAMSYLLYSFNLFIVNRRKCVCCASKSIVELYVSIFLTTSMSTYTVGELLLCTVLFPPFLLRQILKDCRGPEGRGRAS